MEDLNEHIEQSALIGRVISGEASEAEQEALKLWLLENDENSQHFTELQDLWEDYASLKDTQEIDVQEEWNVFEKNTINKVIDNQTDEPIRILWPMWMKYAAAIVVLLGLFWAISSVHSTSDEIEYSAKNQIKDFDLKDGSKISLNVGGRFIYSNSFGKNDRSVKLDGEAFFDVAHDEAKPFEIEAGAAKIVVLGTCFNVRAEKGSDRVDVFVKRGRVSLSPKNDESNPVYITAGHRAVFNKRNGKIEEIPAGDSNSMAWKTKDIYFNNDNLEEVAHVISHTYRCKIKIKDQKNKSLTISVNFSKQPLDAVLKVICSTLDLKVKQEGNTIVLF